MNRNSLTLVATSNKEDVSPKFSGPTRRSGAFIDRFRGEALVVACLLLVALVAMLDFVTESRLSFSLFYLIPAAVCAWWGGFAPGILLSLAASAVWHVVDCFEDPTVPPTARLWNGLIRFCFLAIASSLVSKLQASVQARAPAGAPRPADGGGQRAHLLRDGSSRGEPGRPDA